MWLGPASGLFLRINGLISQIVERFVVHLQSFSPRMVSSMMVIAVDVVVAVDCRAPAPSQRQSRLRKADELTLSFRLAAPIHRCRGLLEDPLPISGSAYVIQRTSR